MSAYIKNTIINQIIIFGFCFSEQSVTNRKWKIEIYKKEKIHLSENELEEIIKSTFINTWDETKIEVYNYIKKEKEWKL